MLIIQRSQIAGFSVFGALAPCLERPYIPSCAEHGAGVGRSSTERSYGAARKGRDGKSTGAVDETATGSANFFGPRSSEAPRVTTRLRSPRCRFRLARLGRQASTRASSRSSGPWGWPSTSTSACLPLERAVRPRSCSRSSRSRESGSSSGCAAKTRRRAGRAAGARSSRLRRPAEPGGGWRARRSASA
jgi:hypothetical protein